MSDAERARKIAILDQLIARKREEIAELQKKKERIQSPSIFGW